MARRPDRRRREIAHQDMGQRGGSCHQAERQREELPGIGRAGRARRVLRHGQRPEPRHQIRDGRGLGLVLRVELLEGGSEGGGVAGGLQAGEGVVEGGVGGAALVLEGKEVRRCFQGRITK